MSKNFRSSFIDLLCCRYTKRRLCVPHSSRNPNSAKSFANSMSIKHKKNDFQKATSFVSPFSHVNKMADVPTAVGGLGLIAGGDAGGGISNSSSSPLTPMLLPHNDQQDVDNDEDSSPVENHNSCHITVGTQTSTLNKAHKRRKHGEKSPVMAYSSLPIQSTSKTAEVL